MNKGEFKMEDLILGDMLGYGSYGAVFSAEYHGKKYAIKEIKKSDIHNEKDADDKYMIKAL